MPTPEPHATPLQPIRPARKRGPAPPDTATLRLDVKGRPTPGQGKVRLLELIGETGSISAAGRAMGMSYRRAWTLVDSLNASFATPLIAARHGGAGGGGATLPPLGAGMAQLYRALEQHAAGGGAAELAQLQAMTAQKPCAAMWAWSPAAWASLSTRASVPGNQRRTSASVFSAA